MLRCVRRKKRWSWSTLSRCFPRRRCRICRMRTGSRRCRVRFLGASGVSLPPPLLLIIRQTLPDCFIRRSSSRFRLFAEPRHPACPSLCTHHLRLRRSLARGRRGRVQPPHRELLARSDRANIPHIPFQQGHDSSRYPPPPCTTPLLDRLQYRWLASAYLVLGRLNWSLGHDHAAFRRGPGGRGWS